eukprot:9490592-Pyramimonas_sp.AAC.2
MCSGNVVPEHFKVTPPAEGDELRFDSSAAVSARSNNTTYTIVSSLPARLFPPRDSPRRRHGEDDSQCWGEEYCWRAAEAAAAPEGPEVGI